ncbi:MAG: hypothetical protein EHM42_05955 [Planctomycetaceae bacterium]|nr:MAG: hypothetical protein EHM42_05955 [Planctomycetaceae bacterium]
MSILLAAAALLWLAGRIWRLRSDDPRVWRPAIEQFEAADRESPPVPGAIVFTGSSSIRRWFSLADDMAPLAVLNRGFGGSRIHQVTHFADRIVLRYSPRAVVFYAGENDVAGVLFSRRRTPEEVCLNFAVFCRRVHQVLPDAPIYFVSIKLSPARRRVWPAMLRANALIREFCESDRRLHFIDVVPAMQGADGRPRRALFGWDGIHLNQRGYAVWTEVIRPILREAFGGVTGQS